MPPQTQPEVKPEVKPELNKIELTKEEAAPKDLDLISKDSIKDDFSNFDKKQTWSLYNTDSNVLAGQNVPIVNSNDTLKLRTQMLYTQCENSNSYFSNNLNSFDTGIQLLTFNKDYNNNDALSKFNSALSDAVNSVWATNGDYMPRPYKQMFGGAQFKVPWITERPIVINNNKDLSKTGDLFGPTQSHTDSRHWNYYSTTCNTGWWVTTWKRIKTPLASTNLNDFVTNVQNNSNTTQKVSYSNRMYKYDSFYYKLLDKDFLSKRIPTGSNGYQHAQFRVFDNSLPWLQNNKVVTNRSLDDWYSGNYWNYSYTWNIDKILGVTNTLNKIENIYLDFSKLLTIDSETTSNYNVNDSSPILIFGWNIPLFSALREASNLALLVRHLYNNWTAIKQSQLFVSFASLVNDIYNQKIGVKDAWNYIKNVETSAGSGNNDALPEYKLESYYSDLDKTDPIAGYAKILNKYNWAISNKDDINVNNLGWTIQKIVNNMSYWTLPYQYIIPQLFKNDIYCSYKIDGINGEYTNDFKIYDGNSKTFNPINIFNGEINGKPNNDSSTNNNSNFNLTLDIKNFIMKDPKNNNNIIAGVGYSNDTLNAKNIYDIANTGTTKDKKINYNKSEDALQISWSLVLNDKNQTKQMLELDYWSKAGLFDKKQLININKEFVQN